MAEADDAASEPPAVAVSLKHRAGLSLAKQEWMSAYKPRLHLKCVMSKKSKSAAFQKLSTWYHSAMETRWTIDGHSRDRSQQSKGGHATGSSAWLFRLIPHSSLSRTRSQIKAPPHPQPFKHLSHAAHKPLLIEVFSCVTDGARKAVAELFIVSDATESVGRPSSANDPVTFVPIVLDCPQGPGQPIVLEVLDTGSGVWPPAAVEYPLGDVTNDSPEISYTPETSPVESAPETRPVESTTETQPDDDIFGESVQETGGRIVTELIPPTFSRSESIHQAEQATSQDDHECIPLQEEQAGLAEEMPTDAPQEATTESGARLQARLPLGHQTAAVFECAHVSKIEKYLLEPFYVVVFKYAPEKFSTIMGRVFHCLASDIPYDAILANFMSIEELPFHPTVEESQLSQELGEIHNMLSSTPDQKRRACVDLLTKFGQATEDYLLDFVSPFTDAPAVKFLPFAYQQQEYLQGMAFSMLQIQLPCALNEHEAIGLLLLISKLLSECIADCGLLKAFEVEEQCFVFHSNSSYLATLNHAIEGLVKLFPEFAVGFCILASPAEKRLKDFTDSLLNDIARKFRSKFTLRSYQMVELFRQLSPLVDSSPQSAQISTDGSMPTPHVDNVNVSDSYTETATPNVCEETGVGPCEIVGSLTPITAYMSVEPNRLPPPVREHHFLTEEQLLASTQLTSHWVGFTSDSEELQFPCNNEPFEESQSDGQQLQIDNRTLEDP